MIPTIWCRVVLVGKKTICRSRAIFFKEVEYTNSDIEKGDNYVLIDKPHGNNNNFDNFDYKGEINDLQFWISKPSNS